MSEKFKTYVAMSQLDSFTIEELAEASGVNKTTVRTVLNRFDPNSDSGYLDVQTLVTGGRGGQPNKYSLTSLGHTMIKVELGQSDLEPLSAALPDTGGIPLGLLAAEDLVNSLIDCQDTPSKQSLIEQIGDNLHWAEKDLGSVGESATIDFNARIARVRSILSSEPLAAGILLANEKNPSQRASEVLIAPITKDKKSVRLASFVEGALSAIQTILPAWNPTPIHNLSFQKAIDFAQERSADDISLDVFLTINSARSDEFSTVYAEFKQVAADFNNVVIFDNNESKLVADIAKRFDLEYRPNAKLLGANGYIDCLMRHSARLLGSDDQTPYELGNTKNGDSEPPQTLAVIR